MWYLFPLASGLCAAIWTILVNLFLKHVDPLVLSVIFSITTTASLFIAGIYNKVTYNTLSYTDIGWLVIIGALNAAGTLSYLAGIANTKPSNIVAVDRLNILYIVIFSILFLQAPFSLKAIGGALLMIVGCALIVL